MLTKPLRPLALVASLMATAMGCDAASSEDESLPGCEDGKCGPNVNPKFSMWVDATRVDDGADHLGDVTDGRRIRVVTLSKPVAQPAPSSTAATKAPNEAKPQ